VFGIEGEVLWQEDLGQEWGGRIFEFCAFPLVILDKISPSLVLNFSKRGGNDLCVYNISSQNSPLKLDRTNFFRYN